MKKLCLVMAVFLILSLQIASASFTYKNHSMQTSYRAGETINGTINIKFINESAGAKITSNFNGSSTLLEMLERQSLVEGVDYNCTIRNCIPGYMTEGFASQVTLDSADRRMVGFKVNGRSVSIESAQFKVTSNAPASCIRQFALDPLDNNTITIYNDRYTSNSCGVKKRGCFDGSLQQDSYQIATVTNNAFCEKMNLSYAPAYKVGATIFNSTSGDSQLTMELFDNDWNSLGECDLPSNSQHEQELSCIINYSSSKSRDYFVCLQAETGIQANYTIRSEQAGNICGTSNAGSSSFNRDYDIFSEAMEYDFPNMIINETTFAKLTGGESLAGIMDEYISEHYDRDCTGTGCTIPFEFLAIAGQTLTFSDASIKYDDENTLLSNGNLYLLEKKEAALSTGFINLNVRNAGMTIPIASKETKLYLYINKTPVFSSPLTIQIAASFEFDITPKFALIGLETEFRAQTNQNVTSSVWKFGDGTTGTSSGKNIKHRYSEEQNYQMEVELTNREGVKSQRTFTIMVGNANESINILMKKYDSSIGNLSRQINSYPSWISTELQKKVDILSINQSLTSIKTDLAFSTEEESLDILERLIELDVPSAVETTGSGELPMEIGLDNMDADYIKELSTGQELTEAETESLRQKIITWMERNYNSKISFQKISKINDAGQEVLVTSYKITANKINSSAPAFLIIDYPKSEIVFMKGYGEREVSSEISSGVAIPLEGQSEIEFLIPEEVEVESLGAYISPEIRDLNVEENVEFIEKESRTWAATIWYIVLFAALFVIYIGLQEWYKRHYENYLFKNRDDIYNMINFIFNARISQLPDSEIKRKLQQSGWRSEQINYATRKLDKKRTGMFEIPIFRFFEQRKIRQEIEKRQQNPEDTRFIKRPGL